MTVHVYFAGSERPGCGDGPTRSGPALTAVWYADLCPTCLEAQRVRGEKLVADARAKK